MKEEIAEQRTMEKVAMPPPFFWGEKKQLVFEYATTTNSVSALKQILKKQQQASSSQKLTQQPKPHPNSKSTKKTHTQKPYMNHLERIDDATPMYWGTSVTPYYLPNRKLGSGVASAPSTFTHHHHGSPQKNVSTAPPLLMIH